MPRFTYSRWDGTQTGFDFDADDVFAQLTDELLFHGDLNQALHRLLQRGFTDRNGQRVDGLRDILQKLRERKAELLDNHDLGEPFAEVAERLNKIVDAERKALDEAREQAEGSGDQRRAGVSEEAIAERSIALDLLPPDLAGQIRSLQDYDWTSSSAQQSFEELVEELRSQVLQSHFNQMSQAMSDMSPESLQRMREMFDQLNQLIEARSAGRDTTEAFEDFMARFGDMFPGNPANLEELLEAMARQMAAMSQLLNSMTPEQRAELQRLSDALLEDIDLKWQVERLRANLRGAFPGAGWDNSYSFSGSDPLDMAGAASVLNTLGELDTLESMLTTASNPGALAEVDIEKARELVGDDAARSLEQLARIARQLTEAGLMDTKRGRLELTPRGLRKIGSNALSELFSKVVKDRSGGHQIERLGVGHERTFETKPYEWGDPFNLSIERTVRNALRRSGAGLPVRLAPEDFEVDQTETSTSSSTVLAIDLSLSMPMRGNFLAAKKVAMALQSLISGQYPRDFLGMVGFGELARELKPSSLPEVSWDYTYGTNMQHALVLSRRMLVGKPGSKQVIMITDGEPTAHILSNGQPFFDYPPTPETVRVTLQEVARLTRDGIRLNTFMLDATGYLRSFVEKMTQINGGRAFYTTPENLGSYVLVDFLEHRRVQRRNA